MPKVVDPELRREEVLEATWRVLAKNGIDGVSIREVAAEAGYSTGVVAHYFKNKDDVVSSALFRVFRQEADRIERRTVSLEGTEALFAIAEEVLPLDGDRSLEMAVWMSFWSRAIADERLAAEQQRFYTQWRARLRRHLREAVDAGEIVPVDCEAEAIRLAGLIDGIGIQAVLEPARFSARRMLRLVREHLEHLAP